MMFGPNHFWHQPIVFWPYDLCLWRILLNWFYHHVGFLPARYCHLMKTVSHFRSWISHAVQFSVAFQPVQRKFADNRDQSCGIISATALNQHFFKMVLTLELHSVATGGNLSLTCSTMKGCDHNRRTYSYIHSTHGPNHGDTSFTHLSWICYVTCGGIPLLNEIKRAGSLLKGLGAIAR